MNANARLAVCAIAFFLCASAAIVAVRRPALGVNPGATNPFHAAKIEAKIDAKIDTLEITARGERTTLRRRADGIWVTAPVTYVADAAGATAAFEAIEKLEPGAIVTTRPQRYDELQVDPTHGIGVRALRGDRAKLDLLIGKTLDGGALVRLREPGSAADPVWQVNGDLRVLFDKVTSEWRDRSVITFVPAEAREIAVDTRDGEQIRVRAEEPTGSAPVTTPRKWTLVRSSREIAELDALVPSEIVSTLSALKASDFADGIAPGAAGLEPPALTITVTLKSGEKDVLLIGGAAGADESYVKTNEGPQVFRVKAFNIERIAQRPIQFRNKLLCPLNDADIEQITVKNGADSFVVARDSHDARSWRAIAPRGLRIDSAKVAPLASAFRAWRAPRIAEDLGQDQGQDRQALGVTGRGAITITGSGPKGRCSVIAVPNASAQGVDSYYLAQAPPSADVFVLPRWMIDRVALKLDEIRAR